MFLRVNHGVYAPHHETMNSQRSKRRRYWGSPKNSEKPRRPCLHVSKMILLLDILLLSIATRSACLSDTWNPENTFEPPSTRREEGQNYGQSQYQLSIAHNICMKHDSLQEEASKNTNYFSWAAPNLTLPQLLSFSRIDVAVFEPEALHISYQLDPNQLRTIKSFIGQWRCEISISCSNT